MPESAFHAILVDFRTFLHGGGLYDRFHVGLGGEYLIDEVRQYREGTLISGVFSSRTRVRGAVEVRERLHFIGFVPIPDGVDSAKAVRILLSYLIALQMLGLRRSR